MVRDNGYIMKHQSRHFKQTQVFGWETEPKDERPSEFVPSTGFSSLSGYYAMPDRLGHPAPPRRKARMGTGLVAAIFVVAIGALGLWGLVHYLHR